MGAILHAKRESPRASLLATTGNAPVANTYEKADLNMQHTEATLPVRTLGRKSRGLTLILALVAGAASLSLCGCSCVDSSGQEIQCPSEDLR
jgi:hypothetical protein